MKLIMEGASLLTGSFEDEINESSGQTERNYYISGTFSTPDTKNRNGRVYSRDIWSREVAKYQKEINERSVNTLGEWQHPPRSTVDPLKAVLRIVELRIDEKGNVVGRAKILNNNTEATNSIKGLIKEGIKIGVSSRGVGKVSATGVVEDFKLITYDAVDMPSDYNAMLDGVVEGVQILNGIVQDKEYQIDENGCVGEVCGLVEPITESSYKEKEIKDLGYEKVSSMNGMTIYQKKGTKPYTDMITVKGKDIDSSNKDTKKLLMESGLSYEEKDEKCPIAEKIEDEVAKAKAEIVEGMSEYMTETLKSITDNIASDEQSLIENISAYIDTKNNEIITNISAYLEDPKQDEITESIVEENKLGEESAKMIIEALKDAKDARELARARELIAREEEPNKCSECGKEIDDDETICKNCDDKNEEDEKVSEKVVDNLVRTGILSKEEYKEAMNFVNKVDSYEDFRAAFPKMNKSAMTAFRDLF